MKSDLIFQPQTSKELYAALGSIAEKRNNDDQKLAKIILPSCPIDLDKPIVLGPKHSNLEILGSDKEKSSLRALHRLKDFTEEEINKKKVWHIKIKEVEKGELHPRTLFVNGSPRPRARYPKFDPKTRPDAIFTAVPYEDGKVPNLHWGTHRIPTRAGDINPDWKHLYDAELVGLHFWTEERLPHLHFNPETKQLTSSRRTGYRLTEGTKPLPFRYFIENLLEALTEPGEWCLLESTGDLYYIPKDGEDIKTTRLEIPTLHNLIKIEGEGYGSSKLAGDPNTAGIVSNIRFENILFSHCDWLPVQSKNLAVDHNVPKTGHPMGSSVQGAVDAGGAIEVNYASDVRFTNCSLVHLRSHAIRVNAGCSNIQIDNCKFNELGGGALLAHGEDLDGPPSGRTLDIFFINNDCQAMGRVFYSACGVLGGAVKRMTIAHNHIHDLYYSGISLGWTWGYAETVSSDHIVEFNDIKDVSQGILNDLGGIYLVGRNTGSIIRCNKIINVQDCLFGGKSIYLDEGCMHILVEQNLCVGATEASFNMHYGHGHILRHNIFADGGSAGIRCSRDDGKCIFSAYHNIIVGSEAPYRGGYAMPNLANSTAVANSNLIWPGNNEETLLLHPHYLKHEKVPFSDWQDQGNDTHAVFADPLFENPSSGNYQLKKESPAFALGFKEWNHSQAGLGNDTVIEKYKSTAKLTLSEF